MAGQRLGAEHYKTFQVEAPISTHTRVATCEEVECEQYAKGWSMRIDLGSQLGQKQAHYIKHSSGRAYKVVGQNGGLVTLEFSPNQPCFQNHRVKAGLPEIFKVKGGRDGYNPRGTPTRVHTRAEFWLEEFNEHQDRIQTVIDKR